MLPPAGGRLMLPPAGGRLTGLTDGAVLADRAATFDRIEGSVSDSVRQEDSVGSTLRNERPPEAQGFLFGRPVPADQHAC
jgi:hypothetical protein